MMLAEPFESLNFASRADAALLEHAVSQRWIIDPDQRKLAVQKLVTAIKSCDPNEQPRTLSHLVRTLMHLEGQNQKDELKRQPDRQLNVSVTPEQLAQMTDEELEALERRLLLGKDA